MSHLAYSPAPAEGALGGVEAAHHPRSRLPAPRCVLRWMYAGRLVVVAAIFLAVARDWGHAAPEITFGVSLTLVAVGVFSAGSFWYSHVLGREPRTSFLYLQVLSDTLLVTWLVHFTGGHESFVTPLYILVIFAAAILLPFLGGVLVGLLASILHFAAIVWAPYGSPEGVVLVQILLFSAVALLTGYLGDHLRQTGRALGEVESELRLLRLDTDDVLGSLSTGVLTVDDEGRLVYINPAGAEMLALPVGEWLGKPVIDVLNRAAPGLGWVISRTRKQAAPISDFEVGDLANGTSVLSVSTTLLERTPHGAPPVTAIFQDVTERRRVEALERRAERLEAVAELSASLAHEIKNPLACIHSAIEQLSYDRGDPADGKVLHGLVVRESIRLSRLLTDFLDFARVEVRALRPVDFKALVRQVVALVRAHPDAEGRQLLLLEPHGGEELIVTGAEDLLHRAVFNLVLNAAQWAGRGGRVEILIAPADSDAVPRRELRRMVRLTVSDSGPGVPPELVEQIFAPFFTRRRGGSGLGLALVQRAVQAHDGIIFLEPADPIREAGASFSLYLPAREPAALPAGDEPALKEISA